MKPNDLASMTFQQLQDWMVSQAEPAFRGRQVFGWLHAKCVRTYDEMTNLSKSFRARLIEKVPLTPVEIAQQEKAGDGTIKYRYRLADDLEVEGVYMPDAKRRTLCVSTQVGCAMGCDFCATSTMGLIRNLTAGEITGQLEAVVRDLQSDELKQPVSNVVFMGMGEPLANLGAVCNAVWNLLSPNGMGLSRRHVTVSTVGLIPAMEEFVSRVPVKLAVSLNATTDEIRSRIMPVNRRFGLTELISCCRNLPLQRTDRLTFEYVLIKGVNDSDQDAKRLVKILSGVRCKVNLIPYNTFGSLEYQRPSDERVDTFLEILAAKQISAFVRKSRGESLNAACGQLVVENSQEGSDHV
ncbi:MAG: 23S rRNA (adenine(2503)-C(2))-methyltransferase RlmN [Deltaproteobacteria bacterium]|nr:23S rRNA (adenine(2503)-C(2))-methyltransferase RlmN [Deltaproteobacteria bacterium]